MSTKAGDIAIGVGADIEPLKRGLKNASRSLGKFSSDVRGKANAWTKYSAVAVGAMAATTAAIYKSRSESIDALAKTADALAITTEKLQALNHIAQLNGVSSGAMAKGLNRMEKGLGEAARKGGMTADALADAGVSLDDIINLSPDQQIQKLAIALGGVQNQAVKASIASDLFGRDGTKMLKVLTQLKKEGVEPTAQALKEMGVSISRLDAAQVEAANDAFLEASKVIEGAGNALTVALAPYVEEVANRFTEAARQSGGFGNEIKSAIEKGMRVAGKFADVLHGLRVVFKGLELVGVGFGAALISSFQLAMEALSKVHDGIANVVNSIIDDLNKIPGVDIAKDDMFTDSPFMQGVRNMGDEARDRVGAVRSELQALALEQLPSDKVESFLQSVVEKSEEAAQKVAKVQNSLVAGPSGGGDDSESDDFTRRLKSIQSRYQTEQQLRVEHQLVMDDIERAWRENRFVSDEEHNATKILAEQDFQNNLTRIRQRGEQSRKQVALAASADQLKTMAGAFQKAGSMMDSNNRKQFDRQKKLSLASSIAALPSAVIQSFQNGGGYPWGLVPAGLMLATGLMNINKIKSSSYSGGGSVGGSVSAGGGSAPSAPTGGSGGGEESRLTVEGLNTNSLFDGETVRTLSERLLEHQRNGGTVMIA